MLQPEAKATLQKYVSEHDGKKLDQKALLHPNPMVAKVLIARLLSMAPDKQQALKSIVTPQTAEPLAILLPELASMIKGVMDGSTAG